MSNIVDFKYKKRKYVDVYTKATSTDIEYQPELTETNIKILLDSMGIKLRFNEITKDTISDTDGLVDELEDDETYEDIIISMVEDELMRDNFKSRSFATLKRKLDIISFRDSYNPIRDYLVENYLKNKENINKKNYKTQFDIVFESLKVKSRDKNMARILLKRWLISCVASQIEEFFASHGVLTLTGRQGMGKTTFLNNLLPSDLQKYFKGGFYLDVKDKDQKIAYTKSWIVEMGEVMSTLKKDMDLLKAFLTNKTDTIRNPYGSKEKTTRRRTVPAATVDELEFLKDDTNRRFWVIELDDIDLNAKFDVDLLWCEIYDLYVNNEIWWIEKQELEALNQHNMRYRQKNEIESFLYAAFNWDYNRRFYLSVDDIYKIMSRYNKSITSTKIGRALSRMQIPSIEKRGRKKYYAMPLIFNEFNDYNIDFNKFDPVPQNNKQENNKNNENNKDGKIDEEIINVTTVTINRYLIPSILKTKIDLNITNKQIVVGKIFIDKNDDVYIPNFKNKDVLQQCKKTLDNNFTKTQILTGENLFKQLKIKKE